MRYADDTDISEHLRDHLTDGLWHDSCFCCQRRRIKGGTGVPAGDTAVLPKRQTED